MRLIGKAAFGGDHRDGMIHRQQQPGAGEAPFLSSQAEARMACFTYIEGFYNPMRLHSGIGYRSPVACEKIHQQAQDSAMTSLPEQVH